MSEVPDSRDTLAEKSKVPVQNVPNVGIDFYTGKETNVIPKGIRR